MSVRMGSPVTFEGGTVGTIDGFQVEKGGISVMVWVPDTQPSEPQRTFCHARHICHHWWEDECSEACDRGEHNHPINACHQPIEQESA